MSGVLPSWAERLIGAPPSQPGQGTSWQLEAQWPWPVWITAIVLAAMVVWVVWSYSHERPVLSIRMRVGLVALRLAVFGVVLIMLARCTLTLKKTGLPTVILAVDASASMGVVDSLEDTSLQADLTARLDKTKLGEPSRLEIAKLILLERDAALVRGLARRYRLQLVTVGDALRTLDSASDGELADEARNLSATDATSRLGEGLREIVDSRRGAPPTAIVLFSDGVSTAGEPLPAAAQYARDKGVPVDTIGLGSDRPVRDAELADLLVDEVVFAGDVVNFQAAVKATALTGQRARITLRREGVDEVLAEAELELGPDGQVQTVQIPYRPPAVGEYQFVVEIEPTGGELQTENNVRRQTVSVREQRIRVLLAQAYPHWEFSHLKTLLERDSTIELHTVLQDADLLYSEADRSAISVFPIRREDLFAYDVILFGDVDPARLTTATLTNIREFVRERGGGLAILAGQRYTPYDYQDTPLAGLFPFDVAAVRRPDPQTVYDDDLYVYPTDLGRATGALQLGESADQTDRLWRAFPPLHWIMESPPLKPAVRVLASSPSRPGAGGQETPVVCLQYFGAGKVLFQATDETWRWRSSRAGADYARYWVQLIRYLARSKLLGEDHGVELTADRETYRVGESARLRVRFLSSALIPAGDDAVEVVAEQPGEQTRRLVLQRSQGAEGVFDGELADLTEGTWNVWLARPAASNQPPAVDLRVAAPPGEFENVRMASDRLREVSQLTRGHFYSVQDVNRLLDDLPRGRHVPMETLPPVPIWNQWWLLLVFLLLITTEWLLRRTKGLL